MLAMERGYRMIATNSNPRLMASNPPPPVIEHARVLIFFVFLFFRCSYLDDPPAVFPALSVFINMAQPKVLHPSFWLDDVVAARDEDEAKFLGCQQGLVGAEI